MSVIRVQYCCNYSGTQFWVKLHFIKFFCNLSFSTFHFKMKQQTIKEREQCRSSRGISCYFSPFYAIAKSAFLIISGINMSPPGKGRMRCKPGKMKTVSKWLKVKDMLWSYTDSSPLELVWQILGQELSIKRVGSFSLKENEFLFLSFSWGLVVWWDHLT